MTIVYCHGIIHCSVCTDETDETAIEKAVNEINPTNIMSKWRIAKEKTFSGGELNPCPCDKVPGRMHYLMEC